MQICGSSSDLIQGCSPLFTITELKLSKVEMELSELNPTAYFDFTVTGYIYEQFEGLYKELSDTVLTNELNIQGELTKSTSTGVSIHSVYCTVAGINTLKLASADKFDVVEVNVLSQKLKISELIGVIEAYDQFSFKVKIFDYSGSVVQSKYGTFPITVYSEPSGLSGTLIKSTEAGEASFSELYFSKAGEYLIKATTPEAIIASQTIIVTFGEDIKITIASAEQGIDTKYLTNFTMSLFNKTSGLPASFVKISVYVNGVLYSDLVTDSNGQVDFETFFNGTGEYVIKVVYSSAEEEINVLVEESNNTDSMCLIAKNQNECSVCKDIGENLDGVCICSENSFYNETIGKCTCNVGLFESGKYCVSCKRYFKPSEITSYYSEDYKKIIINFARPVKTSSLSSYVDIIKGPDYFLSIFKGYIWLNEQVLEVSLTSYPDLTYKTIEINEEKVEAALSDCTLNKNPLNIEISQKYELPVPSVSITGPDSFSLVCGKSSLIFISSSKGDTYKWSAAFSPANTQVTETISSTTTNFIEIAPSYLTIGTLTIQLNLTIIELGWTFASKTVKITNDLILSVQLSTGSTYYTTASKSLKITAIVKEQCSMNEDFTYYWTSPSKYEAVQSAVRTSITSKSLEIGSYTLIPGEKYTFNVEVTQGTAIGTSSTLIIVKESSLILSASKTSGEYSLNDDFVVKGKATDPDNQSASITYTWTCSQDSETCKNSENLSLIFEQDSGQLTIPKSELSPAAYNLYLSAISSSKSAYLTISITFSNNAIGTVSLTTIPQKINPDYIYNVIPEVNIGGFPSFLWRVTGGKIKFNLDYKNSYLGFTENSLIQGNTYKLSMSSIVNDKESVRISVDLKVNNGPECESLNLKFSDPKWVVAANGCVDLDDSDYPLVYQFGVVQSKKEKWITEPVFENIVQVYFPYGAIKVKLRVCDSLETCNSLYTEVPARIRRTEESLIDIIQYTRESSNIPNAFLSFLSNDTEYSNLLYVSNSLIQYFDEILTQANETSSVAVNKYYIELLFDCVKTVMELGALPDSFILSNITQMVISVLDKYSQRIIPDKVVELLKVSESYFEVIETETIVSALEGLASHLVIDNIPGVVYSYSSKHTLVQTRKLSLALVGYTLTLDSLKIVFPKSLSVNLTDIYDFFFACLIIGNKMLIKIKLFNIGSFKSYNLEFFNKVEAQLILKEPLKIVLKNSLKFTSASCSDPDCRVDKVNSSHIELEFFSLIDTEVFDSGPGCDFARVPIQFAGLLISLAVILALVLYDRDKIASKVSDDPASFKTFYNITSLFIKQNNPKRVSSVLQILSTWLVILAVVGLANKTFDSKLSAFDVLIGNIKLENFGSGLLALSVCQFLALTNTLLKLFKHTRKQLEYYLIFINCIVSFVCFILICASAAESCQSDAVAWMTNFTIFVLVHFLIFESIFAIIVYYVRKKYQKRIIHIEVLQNDLTAIKGLQLSYTFNQNSDLPTPRSIEKSSLRTTDRSNSRSITSFSPNSNYS